MEKTLNYKETIGTNQTSPGAINLCRDLSLTNRKNHEHTTRKGVPLVYHCKITAYRSASTDQDETQVLKFMTVPSNWVYRNAAVKLHAAREAMYKNNGVTKKDRGRYDHTIRYAWDNTDSSDGSTLGWITPVDKDGNDMDLGTWDTTELHIETGTEIRPTLWGGIADNLEDTSDAGGNRSLASMYLQSRNLIRGDDSDDTNLEGDGAEDEFPGEHSIIRSLFRGYTPTYDEVIESAQTSQDNPPYDFDDISATASFIEPIVQAKTITGLQSLVKDVVYVDVPFGILDVKGVINQGSQRNLEWKIEVLGVSEMQG